MTGLSGKSLDTIRQSTVDVLKTIRKVRSELAKRLRNEHRRRGEEALLGQQGQEDHRDLPERSGQGRAGTSNVLSWVQKIGVAISESQIKDMQNEINDLLKDQSASDVALAQAYLDYQESAPHLGTGRGGAEHRQRRPQPACPTVSRSWIAGCRRRTTPRPTPPDFGEHWGDTLKAILPKILFQSGTMVIPTVDEDCPPPVAYTDGGGGCTVYVATDSSQWCRFRGRPIPIRCPIPYTTDGGPTHIDLDPARTRPRERARTRQRTRRWPRQRSRHGSRQWSRPAHPTGPGPGDPAGGGGVDVVPDPHPYHHRRRSPAHQADHDDLYQRQGHLDRHPDRPERHPAARPGDQDRAHQRRQR